MVESADERNECDECDEWVHRWGEIWKGDIDGIGIPFYLTERANEARAIFFPLSDLRLNSSCWWLKCLAINFFSASLKLLYSRLVRSTASVQYSKQCRWLILATLRVKRFFGTLRIKTGVLGKKQGCYDCWDPIIECPVAMLSLIFCCYLEIYSRFSSQQC